MEKGLYGSPGRHYRSSNGSMPCHRTRRVVLTQQPRPTPPQRLRERKTATNSLPAARAFRDRVGRCPPYARIYILARERATTNEEAIIATSLSRPLPLACHLTWKRYSPPAMAEIGCGRETPVYYYSHQVVVP